MVDYSLTKHRIIQWLGILLALGLIAVSYWYFNARAGVKTNSSLTDPLTTGLAGYWKLDDGSGTSATDSSTNSYTGTLTSGPTWTTGRIGNAVSFDGVDDYIDTNNGSALDSLSEYAYAAWIYPTSANGFIVAKASNGGGSSGFRLTSSTLQGWRANFVAWSAARSTSSTTVSLNTWSHVVMTYNHTGDKKLHIYLNGSEVAYSEQDTNTNGLDPDPSYDFWIGRKEGANEMADVPFTGSIDEVRIYNRSLSSDEVVQLYRLTTPTGTDTSLKGYWSFNGKDISGTTAFDRSGAGNNGTLTNGPTVTQGKVGQTLDFDGTDDYVTVADNAALDIGDTDDLTLTGWFYRDTFTTDDTIIAKRNGIANTDDGYILYIDDSTDKLTFEVSENSGTDEYQLESIQTFTSAGWNHFTIVWDQDSASNSEIYINGVDASIVRTGTIGNIGDLGNAVVLAVGAESDAGNPFDGKLDEIRVYKSALSMAKARSLYGQGQSDMVNAGISQAQGTQGLVAHWRFDEGSGTTTQDSSVSSTNGTLTGGPTWTNGQIDGAVSFDGTDDYVVGSALSSMDTPATLCAWYKISSSSDVFNNTALSDIFAMVRSSTSNYEAWYLGVVNPSSNQAYVVAGALDNVDGSGSAAHGTTNLWDVRDSWIHVCGVLTSSTSRDVYLNGVYEASSTGSENAQVTTLYAGVGTISTALNSYANGVVDDVRLYNRALRADEIAALASIAPLSESTDTGLKGYWSFNGKDISGTTAYDRSGAGNNGTLTNGPAIVEGKVGQALSFDGTDDYVTVADNAALSPTAAFSVSFWTRITSTIGTQNRIIVAKSAPTQRSWAISQRTTGALRFTVAASSADTGTYGTTDSTSIFVRNQWTHITATYDGSGSGNAGRAKVYVNGIEQTLTFTGTISATVPDTTASLDVGNTALGDAYLTGNVDELRFYNTTLTAAQIQSLYKAGQSDETNTGASQPQGGSRLDSGLAGYWKLDEGSGTSIADSSTNSNTGALINSPAWTTGQIGGAVDLDGTDDYIDTNSGSSGLNASRDMTISVWIYPQAIGSYRAIVGKSATDSESAAKYLLELNASGLPELWMAGSAATAGPSIASYVNTWLHLVVTNSGGGGYTMYYNGVLVRSGSALSAPTSSTDDWMFGRLAGVGFALDAKLDEVRMYNRALSADEVAELYRLNAPTGADTSLKGYWSFNGKDISGTTAFDRSGAGNNGTLTGGAAIAEGKIGQGLFFDGSDDHITFGTTSLAALDGATKATFCYWVKSRVLNTNQVHLLLGTNSTTWVQFATLAAGSFIIDTGGSGGGRATLSNYSSITSANKWTHICGVYDGTQSTNSTKLQLYVDNALQTLSYSQTIQTSLTSHAGEQKYVGYTTTTLDGSIDEVRIYNRALSATEVAALYNAGK